MTKRVFILFLLLACQTKQASSALAASSAGHGKGKLVICSQNLARFGEDNKKYEQQLNYLVGRMFKAKCSVVALQEIIQDQPEALKELARVLSKKTGRQFKTLVGKSRDKYITNGFLLAEDLGEVTSFKSYWNKSLPRLYPYGPSRNFIRGPAELQIELAKKFRFGSKKNLNIISIHFKSKRDGWKDPAKMNFEVERIESAQAVREIALRDIAGDAMLVVLGDRNNGKDKASDEVLEGRVELADLSEGGSCQLTKNEIALCKKSRNPTLLGLFGLRLERFPGRYSIGSHLYRGKESLLDEVFIRPRDLGFVTRDDKSLRIGYVGKYFKGSDHKLLYVQLRSLKERKDVD